MTYPQYLDSPRPDDYTTYQAKTSNTTYLWLFILGFFTFGLTWFIALIYFFTDMIGPDKFYFDERSYEARRRYVQDYNQWVYQHISYTNELSQQMAQSLAQLRGEADGSGREG